MVRCFGCMKEYNEEWGVCPYCGYILGTTSKESYHLPPGCVLQGRYIVGKVLGFGGFGVTYIGYDAELERVVAIKEFLPSMFATRLSGDTQVSVFQGASTKQYEAGMHRFVEEAQTLAGFNGIPGIVDIYDSFCGNNTAYIIMQFLKGTDVKHILGEKTRIDYEQARKIILTICDTLAPVHEKGMVHRDISPDNIYITEAGEIKLLDFGAARYESSMNSKSLSVILKSGYAPEEQYRSKGEQGSWTDVYALAATFYKMITGRTPQDSMERIIQDELVEPSMLGVDIPVSSENALLNALQLRKEDRTQTVQEFKEALLSDGVERIIAKPVRIQEEQKKGVVFLFPIIAVFLVAIIYFAMIDSGTGIAEIGADTFADVGLNEYITVPDLSGLSGAEVEQELESLGLVADISYDFCNEGAEEDTSEFSQNPKAGSEALAGTTVTVQIAAGVFTDALEDGTIPDIMNMSFVDVLAFVDEDVRQYDDGSVAVTYVYSEQEEAGEIIDISFRGGEYTISVGIGEAVESKKEYGEIRIMDMNAKGEVFALLAEYSEPYPFVYDSYLEFYVSVDEGETWNYLGGNTFYGDNGVEFSEIELDDSEEEFMMTTLNMLDYVLYYEEAYADTTLQFRMYKYDDVKDVGEVEPTQVLDLTGTFEFSYTNNLEVDEVQSISYTEAYEVFTDVGVQDSLSSKYQYWKLEGNFVKGTTYELEEFLGTDSVTEGIYTTWKCYNDGELYIYEMLDETTEFTINEEYSGYEYSNAEDMVYVSLPDYVTLEVN